MPADVPTRGTEVKFVSKLAGILLSGLLIISPVHAQPVLSGIASGNAQVSTAGATTIVTQTSSKAIINWQDFSVAAGAAVQFNQPGSSSMTLNRVIGGGLSAIDGAIRANGQVWLLNPNGILFGQNAQVNVGGLLATTSSITNENFLAGRYDFSGGANAVVNNGAIRTVSGGSVVLSAPSVSNAGLIEASAGRVVLGGTESFAVDFNGDHLLSYAVGPSQAGSVVNSGIIRASGGKVLMTARTAAGIAGGVVNNSGMVEATSARLENGEIVLDAGDGIAASSGTLDASGKGAGQTGGAVALLGNQVEVADGAAINVSGTAGGGQVVIGGGSAAAPRAQVARVGKVVINADAIRSGNGGSVSIISAQSTRFAGVISARGGALSGNGGQVETSAYALQIDSDASVTTLAPQGRAGNWLLDPHNITIQTNGGPVAGSSSFSTTAQTDATVDSSQIASALANGNVTLQANNDIFVNNNITATTTAANTLTLQAGRTISISAAATISYTAGTVVLSANDPGAIAAFRDSGAAFLRTGTTGGVTANRVDLILHSNGLDGSAIGSSTAPFIVRNPSQSYIRTAGASGFITAASTSGVMQLGNAGHALAVDMGTGSLTLTTAGLSQTAPISLNNLTINLPTGTTAGSAMTLNNVGNALSGTLTATFAGNSSSDLLTFVNSKAFTVGTINNIANTANGGTGGGVFLRALDGDMTLTGNIDAPRINLQVNNGNINQTSGAFFAHATAAGGSGTLNLGASGNINLTSAANKIEGIFGSTGDGLATGLLAGSLQILAGGRTTINLASAVVLLPSTVNRGLSLTTTGSFTVRDQTGNSAIRYNGIFLNGSLIVPVTVNGQTNPGGSIVLHAAGPVVQNINTTRPTNIATPFDFSAVSDHGSIILEAEFAAANDGVPVDLSNFIRGVITLTASEGEVSLVNGAATRLGTSLAKGGLSVLECSSVANCALHSVQDLTIEAGATLTSLAGPGEDGVILAAQGNFINNSGPGAIKVPNGTRWVIISNAPDNDVFNGLDSGNTPIFGIFEKLSEDSDDLDIPGNRYAFISKPTLTLTANAETKLVGLDYTGQINGFYTVTGLHPGVTGAFLADSSASLSGSPVLSSDGAPPGAPIGSYILNIGKGSFNGNGYTVVLKDGTLTVQSAAAALGAPITSVIAAGTSANAFAINRPETSVESSQTVTAVAPQLVASAPQGTATSNTPMADLAASGGQADGSGETSTRSDAATDYVSASMGGSAPALPAGLPAAGVIIPGFLRPATPVPRPTLTATGTLSAWGNAALWQ